MGDGTNSGATGQNVAIGSDGTTANATTAAGGAVAIGRAQKATGNGAVAIGDPNTANGDGAVALGQNNVAAGDAAGTTAALGAVAIGNGNNAIGQGSVALGNTSQAKAAGAVALGDTAIANNANDVALGSGSSTAAAVATASGQVNGNTYNYAGTAPTSTVSVGAAGAERTITNLAAGRVDGTSTDAINGSQLFATNTEIGKVGDQVDKLGQDTAASFGGNAAYDPATSTFTAPTYAIAGTNYNNVGDAMTALANGGAKSKYFNANSTLPDSTATGVDSVAIGPNAVANNAGDVALGNGATTAATVATATGTVNGNTYNYAGAAPTSTVSIGTAGAERTLTNVAAGRVDGTSTDAINGSQLFATNTEIGKVGDQVDKLGQDTAASFGGNAAYDPATSTFTAPTYAIAGTNYNNVGDAMTALANGGAKSKYFNANSTLPDSTATGVDSVAIGPNAVANNAGDVALGNGATTAATVATATGTVNGNTYNYAGAAPTSTVSIGAAGAERTLTNVAAGRVDGTSTDAINGSQLFATNTEIGKVGDQVDKLGQDTAASFGGNAAYDPATSTFTAPTYAIAGTNYNNVGDAMTALANGGAKSKYFNANSTLPDSTATGVDSVAIGPNAVANNAGDVALGNGATTAATVATATGTVNGNTYNYAGAAPTSTVSIGTAGAERTLTNVAAGRVDGTSTDAINGSQLFATNTEIGKVGDQVDQLGKDTAASFGGNAAYDPTTGAFTAPSYAVGGNTYNNVGDAVTALANGGAKSKYFNANSTLADSTATGTDSVAIGPNAVANNAGDVALGNGATTAATVATATGTVNGNTYNYAGAAPTSTVSIGAAGAERTLTNVAAGRVDGTSTDAINGSQLFATNTEIGKVGDQVDKLGQDTAASFGGNAAYDPATSTFTAPTYAIAGTNYNNVGDAMTALANGGAKSKYFNANSTLPDSTATGVDSVAIGPNAVANNAGDVALGNGATTAATVATATGTVNGNTYNYAGAAPTSTVSIGTAGAERTLTNVAAGRVDGTSTDAINGSQLFATNTEIGKVGDQVDKLGQDTAASFGGNAAYDPATSTFTAPTYAIAGTNYNNVGDAMTALANGGAKSKYFNANSTLPDSTATGVDSVAIGPNAVANNAGDVALGNGATTAATVATATGTVNGNTYNYAGAAPTSTVSIGTAGAERTLTNVAAGRVDGTSTDAINGSQLFATNTEIGKVGDQVDKLGQDTAASFGGNAAYDPATSTFTAPTYAIAGTNYNNVGDAMTALANGGAKSKYFNANSALPDSTATGTDSVAIGPNAVANNAGDVALGNGATTAATVATATGTVNGNTYNYAGAAPTSTVSIGTAGAERTLTNVAAGRVDGTSTDAINGSQLFATNTEIGKVGDQVDQLGKDTAASFGGNAAYDPTTGAFTAPSYAVGGNTYNNVGDAVTALANGGAKSKYFNANSTLADSTATGADSVAIGPNAVANNAGDVALGAGAVTAAANATAGTTINGNAYSFAGGAPTSVVSVGAVGAERQITNVAAGQLSATSTDAVNGSQLFATNTEVGNLGKAVNGGGIKYFHANSTLPDSTATGVDSVAIGPNAVATNDGDVALGLGSVTAVANKTVGATINGNAYTFAGGAPTSVVSVGAVGAERQITNVAAGQLSETSTDAVNGSQLFATNTEVGLIGKAVNGGGIKYFHANSTQADSVASGVDSVAIGPNAVAGTDNSVALGSGATTAAATPTASGTIAGNSYNYAGANPVGVVSVGSAGNERQISNVAAGRVAADSTDAVNGSQLHATNTAVDKLDGRVTNIDQRVTNMQGDVDGIKNGTVGPFRVSGDAAPATPAPTGKDSVAGGNGAVASGDKSTALGNNTQATGAGSVALGNGSVADRANTVSVGSAGNERQIANVAAGVQDTDAVNVSQLKGIASGGVQYDKNPDGSVNKTSVTLNPGGAPARMSNIANGVASNDAVNMGQFNQGMSDTLNQSKQYTDRSMQGIKSDIWGLTRESRGGIASAMAMAGLPQAYLPGKSMAAIAAGTFHGEAGIAIGVSGVSDDGRWIYKMQGSGNTTSDWGASVGVGIQW